MTAYDFLKFIEATAKLQKGQISMGHSEDDSLVNGVYFLKHNTDILLLAMDGCMFYWEKFVAIYSDGDVGGMPRADFEAAENAGLFPCKIVSADLPELVAVAKLRKPKRENIWLQSFTQDAKRDNLGALGIIFANKDLALPIRKVDSDQAERFMELYRRMVLHDETVQGAKDWRPAQTGLSKHNPASLTAAVAWIMSHMDKPRGIDMWVYEGVSRDRNTGKETWSPEMANLRPENTADYGAVSMLMRVVKDEYPEEE